MHREWKQYVVENHPDITADSILSVAETEAKWVVGQLSKLKYQMQTDKPLDEFECKTAADYDHWQRTISKFSTDSGPATWFESPWLLVECYMYRKVADLVMQTEYFKHYDPFRGEKRATLVNNLDSIRAITSVLYDQRDVDIDAVRTWFELSLWGNRCDLSLKKDTPSVNHLINDLTKLRSKILVNDLDLVLKRVNVVRSSSDQFVDIVLDNAGFELFTDLCLLDRLTTYCPSVTQFRLHVKQYPWFVSDTRRVDLSWVLATLASDQHPATSALANKWTKWIDDQKWLVVEDYFWTYYEPFCFMNEVAPELHNLLTQSSLIVFKGDLNYRKLLSDLNWPPTTPFATALRGFRPAFLVALRTNKADLIAGFDPQTRTDLPNDWLTSGEYAVIQAAC